MKKIFFILVALIIIGVLFTALTIQGRKLNFNQGYQPSQPINFSHKLHAGDNKIQCIYCHFAAEQGRHAGIPPVELCMNCHSKIKKDSKEILKIKNVLSSGKTIEWVKVHHFPDFAYFNHSQHVRVGKVSCQKCHGPVETMKTMKQFKTLNMGWCLDCHREHKIAPPSGHKMKSGGDCAKCHY